MAGPDYMEQYNVIARAAEARIRELEAEVERLRSALATTVLLMEAAEVNLDTAQATIARVEAELHGHPGPNSCGRYACGLCRVRAALTPPEG